MVRLGKGVGVKKWGLGGELRGWVLGFGIFSGGVSRAQRQFCS